MNPKSMMAALYVGDLHPDVTEVMLADKFSPAGHIHSIRLCRDRKTGSSLGYAYVNFQHRADAEQALEILNFELLMGWPMRIMWSQRDSSLRNTGVGNLFIKNLDKSIDSKALFDTFSMFGKVLSCKVVGYEKGSKGYGYVHFESPEVADLVMERINGKLLNGRKVFIEHFKIREKRKAVAAPGSQLFTNIYIKNLDKDVDDEKLKDIFSKFGLALSVRVMTDENGKSKGFGFVRFERHEDAQRAVAEMNGKELNGKKVYVGRAQTKVERQTELNHKFQQGLNLYIKNLDDSVDDECLRMEFSRFGTITSAKVMMENGRSRGFGFVHFSSSQEAMKARKEMHGRMWGRKPVYVGVAQRKEERQACLAHQNMQRMASMQLNTIQNICQPVPFVCYTIPEAQNLAVYTPSQMVEPYPVLYWTTPQTIQLQSVQNMPDVVQPAPLHQQTGGTITPSSSQVPCTSEDCTNMATPTSVDTAPLADSVPSAAKYPAVESVPAVETVPVVDSVPAVETVPSVESVPAVETVPSVESVPAVETVPSVESVPAVETVPSVESVPAVETVPSVESVPAVETVPSVESVPAVETVPSVESVPAVETVPSVESVPAVETVPSVESVPAVETVPSVESVPAVETVPSVESVPAVETVPAVDSVPAVETVPSVESVPAVETVPSVESVPAVETVPAGDSVPAVETVPSVESVPAVETVPSVESVPAVATVPAVDSVPAVEAVPAVDSVPAFETFPSVETVPAVETVPSVDSVPAVETVPAVVPAADEVPATTQAPDADGGPSTSVASVDEVQQDKDTTDVPTSPPAGKQLTIYMLESAPVDDQIQMAHDYMLPLVEKIHPTLANKITWMLLEGENNFEIMNMIGDPELLRARVDEMDALLKAREAGHKPEILKMLYNSQNNNNKKMKKKNKKKRKN